MIALFYFNAATANFWAQLNNLVKLFEKSLLNDQYYLFFQIIEA